MGNSKSKKLKISQDEPQNSVESKERINSIKSEIADAALTTKRDDRNGVEQKEKDNDNASSASTVEVLDDK